MSYTELHTSSAFSFLDGASQPATLIDRAAELGYPALALLDRDGVYGAPQFYRAAKSAGLKAIVGAELSIQRPSYQQSAIRNRQSRGDRRLPIESIAVRRSPIADPWILPVLVASPAGYKNLCRLITQSKLNAPKGGSALTLQDLDGRTAGLVALAGRTALEAGRHGVGGLVDALVGIFGRANVWIELQRHLLPEDQPAIDSLLDLAAAFRVPVMAANGVRFASPDARALYDVFTCLRHKTTLEQAGRRLTMNAERYLKPPEIMARLFGDLPDALKGTAALAERLEFTLADLGYRFPDYPVPDGGSQIGFLRHLAQVGARDHYRPYHERARAQIARELDLIEKLNLAGYFLIVWDIVNFCRQQGILVQGRGSAANSAVCYALGITAVDPVGMDLLFERFLSEERGEWPDIDLDLPSGDRRERVIQYVYERYGVHGVGPEGPRVAMTANVITYRGKSAAREAGKVLGLDDRDIDRLSKLMSRFEFVDPEETIGRHLRDAGLDPDNQRYRLFTRLWTEMQDLPRHLGQHSGGMVVCQGRLDEIVPLENAAMPGRVVVQWDKDDCADLGLVKIDLLGLGMMAALEEAIQIVNGPDQVQSSKFEVQKGDRAGGSSSNFELRTSNLDLAHLPPNDPAVYRMLQEADTVGLFQVESRAQMATLPRLRPEHFYDLVVEVAIIRPGPIVGNMVHPYLRRRRGDEAVTYPHPKLEPVLARTLGVPLFQEQLLRMAMVVAGFSGGEAEELRRAMGFKRSVKRMQQIEQRLRDGMARNGIIGAAADGIVQSITSFALYGFPESHAASFALIVYASAYLKAHYPSAFYTALLNNQPMGFYHPATLVKDAQRRGVRFAPIDVQVSNWTCHVQEDGSIRLGLNYVRGLREEAGRRIEEVRRALQEDGRRSSRVLGRHPGQLIFQSIDDLIARAGLRQDEARTLAEIGALASFGGDRRTALWQAERLRDLRLPIADVQSITDRQSPFVDTSPLSPMTPSERVQADYDGTGLTIGPHPMALVRASLATRGVQRARDLLHGRPGRLVRVAGAVITRQRPGTAKGFVFLSLEDETGIANIIVNPDVYARDKRTIVEDPYLLVEGTLQNQDGAVSVKASRVDSLGPAGPRAASHDFY